MRNWSRIYSLPRPRAAMTTSLMKPPYLHAVSLFQVLGRGNDQILSPDQAGRDFHAVSGRAGYLHWAMHRLAVHHDEHGPTEHRRNRRRDAAVRCRLGIRVNTRDECNARI